MKNITSFDAFLSIKNIKGLDFILNYFQVHKGTIKRWEKQQSIPKNYDTDLKKIITQLEIEYPHIDIVKSQNNTLTNKTNFIDKTNSFSQIILGDVCEFLPQLQNIKFNIVIADPPYNIGKNFGNNRDLLEIDEYLKWSLDWIQQCLKLLTPNGIFYMYGYPEILARVAAQFPYDKQRILAWHYTNKNMPSCNFWQRSYESILCLWNNKKPEINIDQIREPYTSNFLKCDGKKRIGTLGRFGNSETLYRVNEKGALPRDIIKVPALAGGAGFKERFFLCKTCDCKIFSSKELKNHQKPHQTIIHPTQKPQMLTTKLIDSVIMKNQKGNVLIPFAGSGSECLVAKKKNLNYIGIEINPDYVMLIKELLKNV